MPEASKKERKIVENHSRDKAPSRKGGTAGGLTHAMGYSVTVTALFNNVGGSHEDDGKGDISRKDIGNGKTLI